MNVKRVAFVAMIAAAASLSFGQANKDVAKQLNDLDAQYNQALNKYYEPYEKAKNEEEMAKIQLDPAKNPAKVFLAKYLALRAKVAKDMELGPRLESQILNLAYTLGPDKKTLIVECLDNLSTKFVKSPTLNRYVYQFTQADYYLGNGGGKSIAYLRKVEANSPVKEVKAAALVTIAGQTAPGYGRKGDAKKAKELFKEVQAKYPGTAYAKQAGSSIFEMDNLQIGMTAPDFEITDENGASWKLSDYRGKVVVLDFWGFW